MNLCSHRQLAALVLLLLACGNAREGDQLRSSKPATAATDSSVQPFSQNAPDAESVRLLKLDLKTSIPYEDRDRTDQHYFYGFRIQATTTLDNVEVRGDLAELLTDIDGGQWTRDVVRDADYGIRLSSAKGTEDLLVCTYCAPPVVARPVDASETPLSAEDAASLKQILLSALRPRNGS